MQQWASRKLQTRMQRFADGGWIFLAAIAGAGCLGYGLVRFFANDGSYPLALLLMGIGLGVTGTAFFFLISDRKEHYRLRPLLLTVTLLIAVSTIWHVLMQQEQEHIQQIVALRTENTKNQITERLKQTSLALKRFAARLEYLGVKDRGYLVVDAQSYLQQLPSLKRIGLIGLDHKVFWAYPLDKASEVIGFDQNLDPKRAESLRLAALNREPTLSHGVNLRSGGFGFLLPAPLFRKDKLFGYLYATVDVGLLLNDLQEMSGLHLVVTESGKTVFVSGGHSADILDLRQTAHLKFGEAEFAFEVRPTTVFVKSHRSPLPLFVLFGGSCVAILLGLFLQSLARTRYLESEHARTERVFLERLNIALQSAKIAVWSRDLETGAIWRSQNQDEIYGYPQPLPEWTRALFYERVHPDDRDRVRQSIDQTILPGQTTSLDFRIYLAFTQELRWLNLTCRCHGNTDGQPTQLIGVVRDITQARIEEQERHDMHERLQRVIEASGEGIWERDFTSRKLQMVDARAKAIFGYPPEAQPSYEEIITLVQVDDRNSLADAVDRHVRMQTNRFETEFRIFPAGQNPGVRWVRAKGRVILKDGNPDRLVATLSDVTEIISNRKKLEEALRKAEEGTTAKSAFLASMSHEIRTPMNAVMGMTDLLLETDLNAEQKKYAQIVRQSGSNLLNLINDILDFSKIEAGKIELENGPFSLRDLVEAQADLLIVKASEKRISLQTYISPKLPSLLEGDSTRLGQVVLNLLGNAIKFTAKGGVSVRVTEVDGVAGASKVKARIEVQDTGIGMSAEGQTKLFQPFSQAEITTAREFGGTGLGLSISKRLVEAMGGRIGVESSEGKGSLFWVEVPYKVLSASEYNSLKHQASQLQGVRSLVVDDDPLAVDTIHRYMNAWGMRAARLSVFDGILATLRSEIEKGDPYQIIVLGPGMKSDYGLAAAGEIRRELGPAAPKLILATNFGRSIDAIDPNKNSFDSIIHRPIKQVELCQAMTAAITGIKKLNPKSSPVTKLPAPNSVLDPVVVTKEAPKILVADDVLANQILALKFLETLGYNAKAVSDGREVLELLKSESYDLILMDCQMPGMDGFETTRTIRTKEQGTSFRLPIVALTANAMTGDDKKCLDAGMDDYLSKPVKKEFLDKMLQKWLKEKAIRKSA